MAEKRDKGFNYGVSCGPPKFVVGKKEEEPETIFRIWLTQENDDPDHVYLCIAGQVVAALHVGTDGNDYYIEAENIGEADWIDSEGAGLPDSFYIVL